MASGLPATSLLFLRTLGSKAESRILRRGLTGALTGRLREGVWVRCPSQNLRRKRGGETFGEKIRSVFEDGIVDFEGEICLDIAKSMLKPPVQQSGNIDRSMVQGAVWEQPPALVIYSIKLSEQVSKS